MLPRSKLPPYWTCGVQKLRTRTMTTAAWRTESTATSTCTAYCAIFGTSLPADTCDDNRCKVESHARQPYCDRVYVLLARRWVAFHDSLKRQKLLTYVLLHNKQQCKVIGNRSGKKRCRYVYMYNLYQCNCKRLLESDVIITQTIGPRSMDGALLSL